MKQIVRRKFLQGRKWRVTGRSPEAHETTQQRAAFCNIESQHASWRPRDRISCHHYRNLVFGLLQTEVCLLLCSCLKFRLGLEPGTYYGKKIARKSRRKIKNRFKLNKSVLYVLFKLVLLYKKTCKILIIFDFFYIFSIVKPNMIKSFS